MALITCPECGRNNVSDSAEACPVCGHGIREHFIKSNDKSKQTKAFNGDSQTNTEQEKRLKYYNNIKPLKLFDSITSLQFLLLVLLSWFFSYVLSRQETNLFNIEPFLIFSVVPSILTILFSIYTYSRYKKYKYSHDNFEAYRDLRMKLYDINHIENSCPICHSNQIQKISTPNRLTSVVLFGLASGKIGKQYECKVCKHKWWHDKYKKSDPLEPLSFKL